MKQVSFLIKPASSSCQLQCKYCFYHDVSMHREVKAFGIMDEATMDALINEAFRVVDQGQITFAFQGGEPTLAGLDFYRLFTTKVKAKVTNHTIQYAIQTNGMKLDDEWCSFFKTHHFLVGVSIDGYASNHNYFRLTNVQTPTHQTIMEGIARLRKWGVDINVLTVLSKQLAQSPEKLFTFYKQHQFDYVQLIPCLSGLNEEGNAFSLTPKAYASFYKSFYDSWLKDYLQGHYMSINLFDNLIPMLNGRPPYQCGMLGFCSLQYVVEADGCIYPCDFYVLDEYCGGNINHDQLETIAQSKPMQSFLKEDKAPNSVCGECQFLKICYGNCKRMNSLFIKNDYCAYKDFLEHATPSMKEIAKKLQ